jgi:hypothetical protein
MKYLGAMLVWTGVVTASAWADEPSSKSDLPVTILEKRTLPQVIFDTSTTEGKGDLFVPSTTDVLIHPVSSGPFEMVPDKTSLSAVAECALSSLTAEEVRNLVIKAARDENVDEKLALAVSAQESGFNANALSEKGALGAMQLMAGTATDLGVNRCDPLDNARGGVRYLKSLLAQFGNPVFALAAYNAGPNNVTKHKGIPPFPETVQYVAQVLNRYYGAPEPQSDGMAVASLGPDRVIAKPHLAKKNKAVADPPDGQVWASGFVMHLN